MEGILVTAISTYRDLVAPGANEVIVNVLYK